MRQTSQLNLAARELHQVTHPQPVASIINGELVLQAVHHLHANPHSTLGLTWTDPDVEYPRRLRIARGDGGSLD